VRGPALAAVRSLKVSADAASLVSNSSASVALARGNAVAAEQQVGPRGSGGAGSRPPVPFQPEAERVSMSKGAERGWHRGAQAPFMAPGAR
jgi:hypothetical protein